MKKNIAKKNSSSKKNTRMAAKSVASTSDKKQSAVSPWSVSIYVYWFIILFFIAATFYILGRSHGISNNASGVNNVEITEEALLQASDYYEDGKTKLLSGDVNGAIADLTTAIDSGDADVNAYILRGEAYMQMANYRDALSDFNTAIEMDSMNAVAYYDRALLNMRLEDYNTALNDINNALAAQTAKPSAVLQMRDLYAKRGRLNLWLKNWEGAIADYTNSLARPDGVVDPSVYAERAEAYTAIGNYADAINDYATAIRIISEQIQGATTAAQRESQSSAAMGYFEKSAALNIALGNVDAARGDLNSAYTIAAALLDNDSMDRIQGVLSNLQGQ